MKKNLSSLTVFLLMIGGTLLLSGCGGDDDHSTRTASYDIELVNLTANQPLSPMAVILHDGDYSAWQQGVASGSGLEQLAEGGSPAILLDEAKADPAVHSSLAGSGAIAPGASEIVTIGGPAKQSQLTVATMLVNTNDAFTGITGQNLSALKVGQSVSLVVPAYDAGSEANDESAATVPGPAAGGEGYNAARNDRNFVTTHAGIVSADDGLPSSVLDESHRFQNPVAAITITRTR